MFDFGIRKEFLDLNTPKTTISASTDMRIKLVSRLHLPAGY